MRIAAVDISVDDKLHCLQALVFLSSWQRLLSMEIILAAHLPQDSLLSVTVKGGWEHILTKKKRKNHPKVLQEMPRLPTKPLKPFGATLKTEVKIKGIKIISIY